MANAEHLKILKEGVNAWNDWRERHPKASVDFGGADLREANLSEANLMLANLNATTLSGANLTRANLIVIGARLSGTDLSGANLSGAYLGGAVIKGANLSGTQMNGGNLSRTVFAFTSLRTVEGLETCKHDGPSSLDYETLVRSGPLPEIFLRGCGLADDYIHYLPSFWDRPFEFYSCFISYNHADKAFARLLHDRLQGQGIRCWLDEHQLLPGDDLHEGIDRGIRLPPSRCFGATGLGQGYKDVAPLALSQQLVGGRRNQPRVPERGANHERARQESARADSAQSRRLLVQR